MGLFESDYNRNILTELERKTRALEEVKANASAERIAQLQTDIDFARHEKLLNNMQLAVFQKRLKQIQHDKEHERLVKDSMEICDGYTNPIEMSKKFRNMEEMDEEIRALKSLKNDGGIVAKTAAKEKDDVSIGRAERGCQ